MDRVYLKVRRCDGPDELSYWEEFSVPHRPRMTVLAALAEIREDPVTADGLPTAPVAVEHGCLEEMCGSCSMVINGKVRQSCSTLVEGLSQPITVEPMGAFPILRDLQVDRSAMFSSLTNVQAWAELDGLHDQSVHQFRSPVEQRRIFALSGCIMCGCCLDACPQINDRSPYDGAFLINSVMLVSERHPFSQLVSSRWGFLKGPGGVASCGNTHNCELACPKDIPLVATIARARWKVMKHSVLSFLKR